MKILWIVNMILPQLAKKLNYSNSPSGTWMFEWANELSKSQNDFAVACVHGTKFQKIVTDNITFYLLPGTGKNMLIYTKKFEKVWKEIVADFKPDIVHIHGTEYSHGLSCIRTNPQLRYLISIQGLLTRIKDVDYAGLKTSEILFNRTFKENIKFNGMIENHLLHKKNAQRETEMITKSHYANCVNYWDRSLVKAINPDIKVFNIEYGMQNVFRESEKWNVNSFTRYTIFTNPGNIPLKGLHILLKAMSIVKRKFPNVQLIVPGMGNPDGKIKITSGYSKYIAKLVHKLDLTNNVVFLGRQSPQQMVDNMKKSHVVVIPSAIEGTSMILREAMYLGCICISSFRGGMANFISNGVDGFAYDFQEFPYLANQIMDVFEMNNDAMQKISTSAIAKTKFYDDDKDITEKLLSVYDAILKNE